MEYRQFNLVKKTGTYADALAAVGLGELLFRVTGQDVRIRDGVGYFTIIPESPIELESLDVDVLRHDPGFPYVKLPKDGSNAPASAIDYEAESQRWLAYLELRRSRVKMDEEELRGRTPRDDWFLLYNLNRLQAFGSYNELHQAIRGAAPEPFRESILSKLKHLAISGDVASVKTSFSPKVTCLQAFNPAAGKGTNRPKPDGTKVMNLSGDWFEEWLRYVGIHLASNAFGVGDDIKVVTLVPSDLGIQFLRSSVKPAFRSLNLQSASIQIDVLASLGLARHLIIRSGMLEGNMRGFLLRRTPREIVAGIQTAYFKNLGSARAVSNTSFIGLPGWFPIDSREDAENWLAIIDEHEACIRALNEERNEDAALLQRYRNFLSANSPSLFLEFASAYGVFLAQQLDHALKGRGRAVRRLSTTNIERLVGRMEKKLGPVLQNKGFRSVAAAIRRATVNEQYMKARNQDVFEIHYGLVQDLRRKARFRDQFVAALCGFVDQYNRENARREEQLKGGPGRRRPSVTTEDLDAVIGLVDEYGSEVIAMLLVAYGTAREPRDSEVPGDQMAASA